MATNRTSTVEGDFVFRGDCRFVDITLSSECVNNAKVADDAAIAATKLIHRVPIGADLAGPTTAVAAVTKLLHIVRGSSGSIVGFEAAVVTKATGTDRTVNVDLQKSTGGGAFATVLTGTILFDDDSVNLTPVAGTIASASLAEGDILQAVVTVAGSDANQALGLLATLTIDETP